MATRQPSSSLLAGSSQDCQQLLPTRLETEDRGGRIGAHGEDLDVHRGGRSVLTGARAGATNHGLPAGSSGASDKPTVRTDPFDHGLLLGEVGLAQHDPDRRAGSRQVLERYDGELPSRQPGRRTRGIGPGLRHVLRARGQVTLEVQEAIAVVAGAAELAPSRPASELVPGTGRRGYLQEQLPGTESRMVSGVDHVRVGRLRPNRRTLLLEAPE